MSSPPSPINNKKHFISSDSDEEIITTENPLKKFRAIEDKDATAAATTTTLSRENHSSPLQKEEGVEDGKLWFDASDEAAANNSTATTKEDSSHLLCIPFKTDSSPLRKYSRHNTVLENYVDKSTTVFMQTLQALYVYVKCLGKESKWKLSDSPVAPLYEYKNDAKSGNKEMATLLSLKNLLINCLDSRTVIVDSSKDVRKYMSHRCTSFNETLHSIREINKCLSYSVLLNPAVHVMKVVQLDLAKARVVVSTTAERQSGVMDFIEELKKDAESHFRQGIKTTYYNMSKDFQIYKFVIINKSTKQRIDEKDFWASRGSKKTIFPSLEINMIKLSKEELGELDEKDAFLLLFNYINVKIPNPKHEEGPNQGSSISLQSPVGLLLTKELKTVLNEHGPELKSSEDDDGSDDEASEEKVQN